MKDKYQDKKGHKSNYRRISGDNLLFLHIWGALRAFGAAQGDGTMAPLVKNLIGGHINDTLTKRIYKSLKFYTPVIVQ